MCGDADVDSSNALDLRTRLIRRFRLFANRLTKSPHVARLSGLLILSLVAASAGRELNAQAPDGSLFSPPSGEYANQPVNPGGAARAAGSIPEATGTFSGLTRTETSRGNVAGSPIDRSQTSAAQPQSAAPQAFTSRQILARVGNETILASDVVPMAEEALKQKLQEIPKEQRDQVPPEQYEKLKMQFTKVLLEQLVEVKIRYADAVSNIPKESLPHIKSSINDSFDKTVLKKLMEKYQATTRSELEEKMAAQGQSLDRQRQMYLERSLAGGWESQHVKENREVSVSEILGYYQQHIADFEYPSKVRWEELMVSIDRFNSKGEAWAALAEMGNDVLRGADFATIAKAKSQGPTRFDGGAYDWTTQGSLVSKVLDEAIFTLPVGRMSQIIEDEQGFHIVRVVERIEAGRKPFLEAQTEIRKKLHETDVEHQRKEFLAKMKERTPVWTIFESAPGGNSTVANSSGSEADVGSRPAATPR